MVEKPRKINDLRGFLFFDWQSDYQMRGGYAAGCIGIDDAWRAITRLGTASVLARLDNDASNYLTDSGTLDRQPKR